MRARTIALASVPVLLGGLGLAVVAGGVNPLDPFTPASEDTPIRGGTEPGAEAHGSDSGTPIDGRRPHLSVIDGRENLFLPAPLPAILSLLPESATDLAPLPSDPNGRVTSAPVDPGGPQDAPAAGSAAAPRHQPAAPAPQSTVPPTGGGPPAASPWSPEAAVSPPPVTEPDPPRTIGDPRFERDVSMTMTGETTDHARPPHAGTPGPPPHAGQTGRPDHAGQTGPPDHAGVGRNNAGDGPPALGSPDHAATGVRLDGAGSPERPEATGGGARKSDDSRPGPR